MLRGTCPKCGNDLKNEVESCTHCNYSEDNTVSSTFKIIGWLIIILGIIGSWYIAYSNPILKTTSTYFEATEKTFNYTMFLIYSFTSIISGALFLGVAEIIKLNQMIFNLMKK